MTTTEEHKRPGAAPSYSREEIADAAIALIDEEGNAGFTVRALAERVGISPMGIYTYFPSKDAILHAVLSRLISQVDVSIIPGERWDDSIRRICMSLHDIMRAHPRVRLARNEFDIPWPQVQSAQICTMHETQGVPASLYVPLYQALRSFMTGFFDNEAAAAFAKDIPTGPEYGEVTDIDVGSFSEESFIRGLNLLIAGAQATFAPNHPCDWRTPEA